MIYTSIKTQISMYATGVYILDTGVQTVQMAHCAMHCIYFGAQLDRITNPH